MDNVCFKAFAKKICLFTFFFAYFRALVQRNFIFFAFSLLAYEVLSQDFFLFHIFFANIRVMSL